MAQAKSEAHNEIKIKDRQPKNPKLKTLSPKPILIFKKTKETKTI